MRKVFSAFIIGLCLTLILSACSNDQTKALYHALLTNTDGNPQGKVTLVEFYDPRCGACHKMQPVLEQLKQEEPELRVVYHEKPVLGPDSVFIAKALLASKNQDRYLAFRKLLMTTNKPLSKKQVLKFAEEAQMSAKLLIKDINSQEIEKVYQKQQALAKTWKVTSTPTYFIGIPNDEPIKLVGYQSVETLEKTINKLLGK